MHTCYRRGGRYGHQSAAIDSIWTIVHRPFAWIHITYKHASFSLQHTTDVLYNHATKYSATRSLLIKKRYFKVVTLVFLVSLYVLHQTSFNRESRAKKERTIMEFTIRRMLHGKKKKWCSMLTAHVALVISKQYI